MHPGEVDERLGKFGDGRISTVEEGVVETHLLVLLRCRLDQTLVREAE